MNEQEQNALRVALAPASVAIIGASDNPHKVGGRPINYMKQFGYAGRIYPVNPSKASIQGLVSYPDVRSLPSTPDLAIIAVAHAQVLEAVLACIRKGVPAAIILSSGFGELGAEGARLQAKISDEARQAGMRLIGPNSQGLANFSNGAVANFSTMFSQLAPQDGPVAIISQSGATSAALYTLLRERGVGVRYVLATGNEADVTVAELALTTVADPAVRLILLYTESIRDADNWSRLSALARQNDVPILALKAGRSASGTVAAQSHTGALANEDAVVDAFFVQAGIGRCSDPLSMADAAQLYLSGWNAKGNKLVVISNSGSSCVMCADHADEIDLPLAKLAPEIRDSIKQELVSFASCDNPIDLTAALMSDSHLLGNVLRCLTGTQAGDLFLISIPVAGEGYDLELLAQDTADFTAATGKVVAVTSTLSVVLEPFRRRGLPIFNSEHQAMLALSRLVRHRDIAAREFTGGPPLLKFSVPEGVSGFLTEAESLDCLMRAGVPVAPHFLCLSADEAVEAWRALDGKVVLKACSRQLPHKSEHGLVFLNIDDETTLCEAFEACRERVLALGFAWDGAIVAQMLSAPCEMAVGAKIDPVFGPVIMIGGGGKYIEAMPDFQLLLPPFGRDSVRRALGMLRMSALFAGVRGEAPLDVDALCDLVMQVGAIACGMQDTIASIDVNPIMLGKAGAGVCVADALLEIGRTEPSENERMEDYASL